MKKLLLALCILIITEKNLYGMETVYNVNCPPLTWDFLKYLAESDKSWVVHPVSNYLYRADIVNRDKIKAILNEKNNAYLPKIWTITGDDSIRENAQTCHYKVTSNISNRPVGTFTIFYVRDIDELKPKPQARTHPQPKPEIKVQPQPQPVPQVQEKQPIKPLVYPWMDSALGVKFLHDKGLTGKGVLVGVIDTVDSQKVSKSSGFKRSLLEGSDPFSTAQTCHSSHVTGVICGRNIEGRNAIAPDIKVLFKGFSPPLNQLPIKCNVTAATDWQFQEGVIPKGNVVTVTQPNVKSREYMRNPLYPEYAKESRYFYKDNEFTILETAEKDKYKWGDNLPVYGCTGYPYLYNRDNDRPLPLGSPLYPGNLNHIEFMGAEVDDQLSQHINTMSERGIKIINFSVAPFLYPKTQAALHDFANEGGVFVIAAGNDGDRLTTSKWFDNSQRFGAFEERSALAKRIVNRLLEKSALLQDQEISKLMQEVLNQALLDLDAMDKHRQDSDSDPLELPMAKLKEQFTEILDEMWRKYGIVTLVNPRTQEIYKDSLVNPLIEYKNLRNKIIEETEESNRSKLFHNYLSTLINKFPKSLVIVGNLKTVGESQPFELFSKSTKAGDFKEHYIAAWGEEIPSIMYQDNWFPKPGEKERKKITGKMTGSSQAAPMITAIIADLYQGFPQCTPLQIKDVLLKTASTKNLIGTPDDYGRGVVDAKAAYEYLQTKGCG